MIIIQVEPLRAKDIWCVTKSLMVEIWEIGEWKYYDEAGNLIKTKDYGDLMNSIGGRDQSVNGQWIEENKTLMEMIINSKKETIKNMQE